MNREAVIGEWRRSQESLGAAETLMRSGNASDAVSRAYYAIMHAASSPQLGRPIRQRPRATVSWLLDSAWPGALPGTPPILLNTSLKRESHLPPTQLSSPLVRRIRPPGLRSPIEHYPRVCWSTPL